jgi:hypothetical protein
LSFIAAVPPLAHPALGAAPPPAAALLLEVPVAPPAPLPLLLLLVAELDLTVLEHANRSTTGALAKARPSVRRIRRRVRIGTAAFSWGSWVIVIEPPRCFAPGVKREDLKQI